MRAFGHTSGRQIQGLSARSIATEHAAVRALMAVAFLPRAFS